MDPDSNDSEISRNINWDILPRIYEFHPENYEELLSIQRVGPAIVQGLALVVELVYDEEPSWEDPVRFSFAYGGKDGEPYPVDHKARDQSIEILRESVQEARIGTKKNPILHRLRRFVPASTSLKTGNSCN